MTGRIPVTASEKRLSPSDVEVSRIRTRLSKIVKYQSNPTTMTAAEDAGAGWLFIVARDGKGGMAWRGVEITVE